MLEIVRILDNLNIIEILYKGAVNINELKEGRKEVHKIYDKHGLMHALLDMRDTKLDMSTLEIYDFAKAVKRPICGRIALLVNNEDDNIKFLHTVANNNSAPMKLFYGYSDALDYLTK